MVLLRVFVFFTVFYQTIYLCYGQSVIDELSGSEGESAPSTLSNEKIEKISPSRKIYLITNGNQSFQKGDFISLIFKGTMFARALVAKDINGLSGIKILRKYSPETASFVRPGHPIQVIRGDDSFYKKGVGADGDGESGLIVQTEEDLFNKTAIWEGEDDTELTEKERNLIKQDNIISIWYGRIEGADLRGESARYNQILASWGLPGGREYLGRSLVRTKHHQ